MKHRIIVIALGSVGLFSAAQARADVGEDAQALAADAESLDNTVMSVLSQAQSPRPGSAESDFECEQFLGNAHISLQKAKTSAIQADKDANVLHDFAAANADLVTACVYFATGGSYLADATTAAVQGGVKFKPFTGVLQDAVDGEDASYNKHCH